MKQKNLITIWNPKVVKFSGCFTETFTLSCKLTLSSEIQIFIATPLQNFRQDSMALLRELREEDYHNSLVETEQQVDTIEGGGISQGNFASITCHTSFDDE